ncbi:cytochrome P450 [Streptomyces sp. NBC_00878]|uniref:cytochrome P450 n=1 Tax=Streptomyces sp. NBC_00878 TaxID=2975854 RepID=UPI00225117C5|nr:cytochrome P450 [Streptomyces sp. NBC_00878]MCX4907247.1 cytochrome P450 [Streptomyces sp. NBC_00878]
MAAITEIPGPKGLPLLGSALDLRRDSLNVFLRARRDHGDVVRFSAGPPGLRTVLHCVFSAEGVQQVLGSQAANFRKDNQFYEELRLSAGNGLLTAQDADYLRQRRLIQPLFTKRQVNTYATAVTLEADGTVERWRDAAEGAADRVVDVRREMDRLALRAVSRILFGADVEAAVDVIHNTFPVVSEYVTRRGFSPVNPPRSWPLPSNRRAEEATQAVYAVCDRIIAERRAADGTSASTPTSASPGADDLLSLLSRANSEEDGSLDATELRDQVLVFLVAGHETTATSMAFALHLLSRHPEAQKRAHEEADRLPPGRTPSAADLEELPYLTRVLKETMRLYPAAPVVGRRSVEAAEIDGHVIPADADVLILPWVTHRHPDLWDDPDRFDPDRFTPEREATRHRYAWFPFGGGPRACIGQHFSMLESVLALATLLRSYELETLDTEIPLAAGITLQATGPMRVRVRART